ncbi:hypothetical protein FUAX_03420 [Fulvitalea axinellae]|uniref:Lipoprotein n=1 Tax=Fulvitalea axinellae TaxID=1182444 RepID=A0AAU9CF37_9BACT|nr:hypothetical protein FUAX_03420 [Fulvitalea axinellae]
MNRALLFILTLSFLSCQAPKSRKANDSYFATDSLLVRQLTLLDSLRPSLEKSAVVDGESETAELPGEKVDWKSELDFLKQVNLNDPALRGVYQVQTSGETKTYTLKPEEQKAKFPVKRFVVTRYPSGVVKSVSAEVLEQSPLFFSKRDFSLEFGQNGKLQDYMIHQEQKVQGADTVRVELKGNLKY